MNLEPKRRVKADTDLGSLAALAVYMNVGRTWLSALKKCAKRRAAEAPAHAPNPNPFVGQKATKQRIMQWLERNPDFEAAREYPRSQSRRGRSRDLELSGAGRCG
jgi:hypothetical protein